MTALIRNTRNAEKPCRKKIIFERATQNDYSKSNVAQFTPFFSVMLLKFEGLP